VLSGFFISKAERRKAPLRLSLQDDQLGLLRPFTIIKARDEESKKCLNQPFR
jgi:hypothetical protein